MRIWFVLAGTGENLTYHLGGHLGVQYIHIPDKEQCDWLRERIEVPKPWNYTVEEKRMILDRLIWCVFVYSMRIAELAY